MKSIQNNSSIEDVFAKSFSEWINNLPNKPVGFLSALSKELNVSVGQLSNVLSGRRKTDEGWRRLVARKIGVPYEMMIGLPSQPPHLEHPMIVHVNSQVEKDILNSAESDYRGIPLYESGKLAAGVSGVTFDPYEIPSSLVVVYKPELKGCSKHNLAALKVGGDSMEPTITMGSIVVVDLSDKEFYNRKVYVVNTPEGGLDIAAVKRVHQWSGGFLLVSDNHNYSPVPSELDWDMLCVGRVVWMWRNIRDV